MRTEELAGQAPAALIEVWQKETPDLTPIQGNAISSGLLASSKNFLVMAPTSSGKTLVGEMAAATAAYTRRGSSVFAVPFKALADEHFHRFRDRYGDALSVVVSTGDWTEYDEDISRGNFGLAVMTYEKLAALLIQTPGLLARLNCVVIDEVQMISEAERGARLELLITSLLGATERPQIIALSASLDALNELDEWLEADLVTSSERPVPLYQAVVGPGGEALAVVDGELRRTTLVPAAADRDAVLSALVASHVSAGRQLLVFRTTVAATQNTAEALVRALPAPGISSGIADRLNELESSDVTNALRRTLAAGAAFHNADMSPEERRFVEDSFRTGDARVLVSTTTLAMGVNLPTDIVIVADTKRFAPHPQGGWQATNISVSEYRNAAGRAGRLGLRAEGTSLLLSENDEELRQLLDFYILGEVETVESQIPRRPFTDLVFQVVTSRNGCSREQIVELVTRTFAFRTFYDRLGSGLDEVTAAVTAAVARCLDAGLLVDDDSRLFATPIGQAMARRGVSFESALALATVVQREVEGAQTAAELYYAAAATQEAGGHPYVPRVRGQPVDPRPMPAADGMVTSSASGPLAAALSAHRISEDQAKALVKTSSLMDFASAMEYPAIARRYSGAAPSRVMSLGRNVAWLLEAIAEAAGALGISNDRITELRKFSVEARYGVPSDAAELARLRVPGITRDLLSRLIPIGLASAEAALGASSAAFDGVLTASQVARLKEAILRDAEESLARQKAGQLARLERLTIPARILEQLYEARGAALEQAVTEALAHMGISAHRLLRQPHGEEDIQVTHPDGIITVSVTASDAAAKKVTWNKAREVLGTGAGLNPVNFVCIGRPDFDELAIRRAGEIARETGPRSILLVPLAVFAEAFVRVVEGQMEVNDVVAVLGDQTGWLTIDNLPRAVSPSE